jgi:uncharacterized protein (TIGR02145 family)
MCHNLGADTSLDPNIAVQGIHGNYYQWGRSTIVANASTPAGAISGWNMKVAPDGSWSDNIKTSNDPCPSGYRVPTLEQWDGVRANNEVTKQGSWADDGNFTTAWSFGIGSTKMLTLPAAGYRDNAVSLLYDRGRSGNYWASSIDDDAYARSLFIYIDGFDMASENRSSGFSVRCVSE